MDKRLKFSLARLWLYRAKDELTAAENSMKEKHYNAVINQVYPAMLFAFHALLAAKGIDVQKSWDIIRAAYKQHSETLDIPKFYLDNFLFAITERHLIYYEECYLVSESNAERAINYAKSLLDGISSRLETHIRHAVETHRQFINLDMKRKIETDKAVLPYFPPNGE